MTTLNTLSDDEMLHFQVWRANALQIMPYFSSLLFSFRPIATDAVDTFAIDPGHRVYINFKNCIPRGPEFCAEGLLHEAGHLLGGHDKLARLAGVTNEERKLWNLAGDFAINDDLRDAGCSLLAAHGVFASMIGAPDYETPLYYMDRLRARRRPAGTGKEPGVAPLPGTGPGTPRKGCGSGAGGEKGDYELDLNDDFDGRSEGASDTERTLIRIRVAASVKQHQGRHGIGSVPGGIVTALQEELAPTSTPWERTLGAYMRQCAARKAGHAEQTYTRRNRRRMNEVMTDRHGSQRRVIIPGTVKPIPSIRFYRDTSGSVSDHSLALATSEVLTISRQLGIAGPNLVVTDLDADVHASKEFRGAASVTSVHGRGGTDMRKAVAHSCALRDRPTCIIIATDGETPWPAERPAVPVIVLLVNATPKSIAQVPEWALTVEIGDNK